MNILGRGRYSDVLLAVGVLVIVSLMVLRLPVALVDALVAVNIAIGIGLLLIAIYIPSPVAFNSFPSVLLISTLFRLALSVATTRLILLGADAGHIIDAFGNFVAGGNLVVGIVVFIIITVVQFIVIAKGAERVAEVAARFTLDAMPGKQMSIDSDLRAGLITQDEAKAKRKLLEKESQLNGALDGAMKFVKGDSIASIIIVVVNLVGGLAIGLLQRGMPIGDAVQVYSILTIGDGMVAQIPALLGAMAAGLVVTRTTGENDDKNLGEVIGRQIVAQPRAMLVTGLIALLLSLVPGFPSLVFLGLAVLFLAAAHFAAPKTLTRILASFNRNESGAFSFASEWEGELESAEDLAHVAQPLVIEFGQRVAYSINAVTRAQLTRVASRAGSELGVPVPPIGYRINTDLEDHVYRIMIFDVIVDINALPDEGLKDSDSGSGNGLSDQLAVNPSTMNDSSVTTPSVDSQEWFVSRVESILRKQMSRFLGTQEVSNMIDDLSRQYPALIKEVLRAVPVRNIAEIMRNLIDEGIPIRNLRDIFESLAEWGAKEKDPGNLTELVRIGLKRYMTARYVTSDNSLAALVMKPETEEKIRHNIHSTPGGSQLRMNPEDIKRLQQEMQRLMRSLSGGGAKQSGESVGSAQGGEASERNPVDAHSGDGSQPRALLVAVDVRRFVKSIIEQDFPDLPVLSYQELKMPVNIIPVGRLAL